MKEKGLKKMRRIGSVAMTAVMSIALIPSIVSPKQVNADSDAYVKSQENTRMGVYQMANPRVPTSKDDAWQGSYVYYGVTKTKYRVLDKSSTKYGGNTLFLDCDEVLMGTPFDSRSNKWKGSDISKKLEDLAERTFTSQEFDAIANSKISSHVLNVSDSYAKNAYVEYVALTGEKLFLLDAEDVLNKDYGYWPTSGREGATDYSIANHMKSTSYVGWWLRSAFLSDAHGEYAGYVTKEGNLLACSTTAGSLGVAPAMNIDKKSILFSSAISGKYGDIGTSYKLTLLDKDMEISIREDEAYDLNGRTMTIPYTISGRNSYQANRVSVLILDNKYVPGSNANILYYKELDKLYYNTGSFTLPDNLDISKWGVNYHVYIIAEAIKDATSIYWTDYATAPVEISMPKDVEIDLTKGGLTGKYWDIGMFGDLGSLNLVGFDYQEGNDYQDVDLDKDGNMDIRTHWMGQMYMERLSTCSVFGKLTFSSNALLAKGYKSITFLFPLPSVSISSAVPAGKNKVKLTWGAAKGAEGYLIYAQKNGQYGYVGMTTSGTTYTDTKALDTDYNYYWVFAYFKNGDKMIPGGCVKYVYAKGVCAAVTNLKASSQTGSVKLSWTASTGAEGYLIYGIRPGGSYGYIGMTTQGTTYTDTKASKTDYTFYWVFPYHKTNGQMIVGGTAKYTYGKAK